MATNPIAGVRAHVATALASLGIPVYTYDPGAVQPPAAILLAGSPYRDGGAAWGSTGVRIDVRIVLNDSAGADAWATLDDLIDTACAALVAAEVQVDTVGAPTPELDQGALVVDIPTLTVWKDE